MLHEPPDRVGGRGSDDDSPALREPDVVDAHRHGLVAERVREPPAHDRHVEAPSHAVFASVLQAASSHFPAREPSAAGKTPLLLNDAQHASSVHCLLLGATRYKQHSFYSVVVEEATPSTRSAMDMRDPSV